MDTRLIRNFCIISHIDHGKSTLADRFLELSGVVAKEKMVPQMLDSMNLEKEKGITIKMHPCRLLYRLSDMPNSPMYALNLIDTPGHIDFSYEISRALNCVEGAVLLVDGFQGIQAQTLHNLSLARQAGLVIIGAVNKIDLPGANVKDVKKELSDILKQPEKSIFEISAKKGINTKDLLEAVIERAPCPQAPSFQEHCPQALIFDSLYDPFFGVVAYLRVFNGSFKQADKIFLMAGNCHSEIKEIGYFSPYLKKTDSLGPGEIGYIKTGIKDSSQVRVGDTITISNFKLQISNRQKKKGPALDNGYQNGGKVLQPLLAYQPPQPVLFLGLYPALSADFFSLKDGLEKLKLNDPSLQFQIESKTALGKGFKVGFLGSLHAEITVRRLKDEFGLDLITTSPHTAFEVILKNGQKKEISSAVDWPGAAEIAEAREPWAALEVIVPQPYFNSAFKALKQFKVLISKTTSLTAQKFLLKGEAPLREIIGGDFYNSLKSATSGYGSFSFHVGGLKKARLVRLEILIAGKREDALSRIVSQDDSFKQGKKIIQKLKALLPPQQFDVALQASLGGRIIARETVKARRKDVTAPLYGGDVTRKKKLLKKQKKGKIKLKEKGRVNIPPDIFLEMFKT